MPTYPDVDFAQPEGYRPLSLDLRTPEVDGAPLIVFLHGGGFRRGSRKVFTPGLGAPDSFDRIVSAGFAVASCEYRLSAEARFPAQLDDVDAAIAWLREHAAEYRVDASRLVLWGVSAGATIGALAGLRRDDIRGIVDWFGPADLFSMAEHETGEAPRDTREAQWIGGTAAEMPDVAEAASPVRKIHSGAPPFHISHGTEDEHVPFAQSAALARALSAAGVDVEFRPVPGAKHFWQGVDDTAPLFDAAIAFVSRVTAYSGGRL